MLIIGVCDVSFVNHEFATSTAIPNTMSCPNDPKRFEPIERLATALGNVFPRFRRDEFLEQVRRQVKSHTLFVFSQQISDLIQEFLPEDPSESLKIVAGCLEELELEELSSESRTRCLYPLVCFVHDHAGEQWDEAMSAVYQLCKWTRTEYAIRPILKEFPQRTMQRLLEWCDDPSSAVRLLCSEAARIRSPWASRIEIPRHLVLPVLGALRNDSAPEIQKSVGNHLSDLGKTDEHWLLNTTSRWLESGSETTRNIVRIALDHLVKEANPMALRILGFEPISSDRISFFVTPQRVTPGEFLSASLDIVGSLGGNTLMVEWVILFVGDSRKAARRVYRDELVQLEQDVSAWSCQRTFRLTDDPTFKLVPGNHRIEVHINGQNVAGLDFQVVSDTSPDRPSGKGLKLQSGQPSGEQEQLADCGAENLNMDLIPKIISTMPGPKPTFIAKRNRSP